MKNYINKEANLSTLGMYCGGKDQEPKLQWSSKAGREKQEKCNKATLQTRRGCKKKGFAWIYLAKTQTTQIP